ncbi:phosphoadenylyl-sulfate reductase [Cyanobium sp. WAJ14-Wanaka]|uniref:phosphoadenylyl-sulfate reductase n=1 Tax=Cyanobium sp. WAJ14-Wanaka TaxID=2823725 RepID=UPI0020CF0DB1|nr:phosphoadenylyl-sulfate reductase [Cyanobium sp. WAJ14-Wanaka]MCP9776180.1 phosphoadenylyl-sulfate reductase [Cyanobium sp. WAJ14-Wanaka]
MVSVPAPRYPSDCQGRQIDLEEARTRLEPLGAQERLVWAQATFGDGFALTTSFGIQAAVLLHMVSGLAQTSGKQVQVIWVDTGYLPPETYQYAEQLCQQLELKLYVAQAVMSPARMEALHGRLWQTETVEDLNIYHRIRKVDPLDQALDALAVTCWASGVRGRQTDHRNAMQVLDPVRERWSLRPLLSWSKRDVFYYMQENGLPQHPLFEQGYSTVGDWHSSAPDGAELSGRATRFGGLKQECGIHLPGVMGEGI